MGKIAFIFSGQGDQFPGMGRELYERYPAARAAYALCDAIRPGTSAQCFGGTAQELQQTENTQPCLFAMELALASALMEKGVAPGVAAGFSLGEVVAATVSGAFDRETGFRLVCRRGELMQREGEKADTAMAAVLRLTDEQVQAVCSRYDAVYPVNYNCPGQVTVSGLAAQMTSFAADVKAAGGRVVPLKVAGAFHSPFMHEAARAFAQELALAQVKKPSLPLYANMTAKPYGENVAELLSAQICHPVLWEKTIRNMIADGVDTFIEIGPGKTLTNMVKKISADVRAVGGMEYLSEVKAC